VEGFDRRELTFEASLSPTVTVGGNLTAVPQPPLPELCPRPISRPIVYPDTSRIYPPRRQKNDSSMLAVWTKIHRAKSLRIIPLYHDNDTCLGLQYTLEGGVTYDADSIMVQA
jgi:hypothetical protein